MVRVGLVKMIKTVDEVVENLKRALIKIKVIEKELRAKDMDEFYDKELRQPQLKEFQRMRELLKVIFDLSPSEYENIINKGE